MERRHCDAGFRVRDSDGEKRIEGYFATFTGSYEMFPGWVERIDPHAFDGQLEGDIRCLIDHDTRLVLGRTSAHTLTLRVDEHGLWGSVLINPQDSDAMNLYARVQRGDVSQCSFGFDILNEDPKRQSDGSVLNTILAVRLYEVSCVTFPAYRDTEIKARKERAESIRHNETEGWKAAALARLKTR